MRLRNYIGRQRIGISENGYLNEALNHILAIEDYNWAADLVAQVGMTYLWERGEFITLQKWFGKLPDSVVAKNPKLTIIKGWAHYSLGEMEVIEPLLQSAEKHITPDSKLRGHILALRAFVIRLWGDRDAAIQMYEAALTYLADETPYLRGLVALGLAETYYLKGDLEAAIPIFEDTQAIGWDSKSIYIALIAMQRQAEVLRLQNKLYEALTLYHDIQQKIVEHNHQRTLIHTACELGMVIIYMEWLDWENAEKHLAIAESLTQFYPDALIVAGNFVMRALMVANQGNLADAQKLITQGIEKTAENRLAQAFLLPSTLAYQALFHLLQGNLAPALHWANTVDLPPEKTFSRETEIQIYLQILLHQEKFELAQDWLDHMLDSTKSHPHHHINFWVIQAMVFSQQGKTTQAKESLWQALELAKPQNYLRTFLLRDASIPKLLYQLREKSPEFIGKILAGIPTQKTESSPLATPLSERELEVLALMAQGMSNQEIANALVLSLPTIKSHARNVYAKLGVNRRTEAIAKGRTLGLLKED